LLALLQFDAAALPVIDRMLAEGRLPTLAELRRKGLWHAIDAAATVLQSATYPTLYTGVDVRRHGIYSTYPWSPRDQRSRHVQSLATPRTIWERLTEAGSRALVVDPYISWPPDEMAGVFLSGWQFEDRMTLRAGSVPRRARPELVRRLGRPPRLDDVYGAKQIDRLERERERLVAAPGRTAQAVTELLRREPFDVLWITFAAAHKAGHQLWRDLPEGLDEVYAAVDRALQRIVAALPSGADVIVFSPTGMGPNTSRAELLPGMLSRILAGGTVTGGDAGAPIWGLRAVVPPGIRAAAARALPDRLIADLTTRLHARADWSRTRAFTVAGENKGYIRLNLRERERDGIVAAVEGDELLAAIEEGLVGFLDPDGAAAVTQVIRMPELADGEPYSPMLPDLIVVWGDAPTEAITHVSSRRYGTVHRSGDGSGRSGNHVDDAWALIVPGTAEARELDRPLRITDIGATACTLFGADLGGLSGESLLEWSSRQPQDRTPRREPAVT
jgi:predicted AlkP superfamily phosphohydrolase/phosphomutase